MSLLFVLVIPLWKQQMNCHSTDVPLLFLIYLLHASRSPWPWAPDAFHFSFFSSCSDVLVSKLTKTKNQTIEHNGILATKLCTHKENVNQINEIHLSRLSGDKKVFQASDSDSGMCAMLDNQVPVGQTLELKEGAQVTHYSVYTCI